MVDAFVNESERDGVKIISFENDLDEYADPDKIRNFFENDFFEFTSGTHHLVIDLNGVTTLDSACFSPLIERMQVIEATHGAMAFCGVTAQRLIEILSLTKFDQVFDIFDSLDEAVEAVASINQE